MFSFLFGPEYGHGQITIPSSFFDLNITSILGESVAMQMYRNRKVLVITVSKNHEYEYQLDDINTFVEKYAVAVQIIAVPLDHISWHRPDEVAEVIRFYTSEKKLRALVLDRTEFKNVHVHPLIQWLEHKRYNQTFDCHLKGVFQKFLINENGKLQRVFDAHTDMFDNELVISVLKESPIIHKTTCDYRNAQSIGGSGNKVPIALTKPNVQTAPWL